jgi:hypothetical protein
MVHLEIETDCETIASLAGALKGKDIDGYAEIGAGFDGVVMAASRAALSGCCAGCVVPAGIFKAVQVAARVTLPRDVSVTLTKE